LRRLPTRRAASPRLNRLSRRSQCAATLYFFRY
jgi:hypothetical protein